MHLVIFLVDFKIDFKQPKVTLIITYYIIF